MMDVLGLTVIIAI